MWRWWWWWWWWRENNRNEEEEEEGKMGIKKLRKENYKIVKEKDKKRMRRRWGKISIVDREAIQE